MQQYCSGQISAFGSPTQIMKAAGGQIDYVRGFIQHIHQISLPCYASGTTNNLYYATSRDSILLPKAQSEARSDGPLHYDFRGEEGSSRRSPRTRGLIS